MFYVRKKARFTESVVKASHDFWKLLQQPSLKTSNNLINVLKHVKHETSVLRCLIN